MRNSREIVRQKWLLGRADRAIAESVGVSLGVVSKTLQRASAAGLTWEAVQGIEDDELERRLYPHAAAEAEGPEPDCVWIHRERHRPSVTLELLHHEYLETLLFRRLDRLGRALERSHREIELLSEAFGVFVHVWFAHTPPLDEEEEKSARRDAESRHKQFLEHVTQRFSGGRRFLDDSPRESIADDAELIALAKQGGGSTDS